MNQLRPGDAACLEVDTHPRNLCLVRTMVRSFAALAGFGGGQLDRIALAVDEACANVIRHAYQGRDDGRMVVSCSLESRPGGAPRMVVQLLDHGECLPCGGPAPREREPLVPGGLGLHLMREIMEEVRFGRAEDGGNLLELAISCPEDPAGASP